MTNEPGYDVIIVGGGTAGCVLANRLSEDPSISVLLLEAGEDCSNDVYTPALAATMQRDNKYDWNYESVPQPGINGRTMPHPRGGIIGGTSAINSFALVYPSKAGLDVWEDLGSPGWGWAGMKEYYRKFQTVNRLSDGFAKELNLVHGEDAIQTTNGPIQASFPTNARPLHKTWVDTFKTLDLQACEDTLEGDVILNRPHLTKSRAQSCRRCISASNYAQKESPRCD